jgi:DNA-binding MarR family transcriptional regulator
MERREGKLVSIGEFIERNERNIVLKGADILTTRGFTQVPNHVLDNAKLSPGAKLTYAMLLKYAWQNDYCFPGQERLAKDMGGGQRSVVRYIQELERTGFIKIVRRGQGRANLYELNLTSKKKVA